MSKLIPSDGWEPVEDPPRRNDPPKVNERPREEEQQQVGDEREIPERKPRKGKPLGLKKTDNKRKGEIGWRTYPHCYRRTLLLVAILIASGLCHR